MWRERLRYGDREGGRDRDGEGDRDRVEDGDTEGDGYREINAAPVGKVPRHL